MDRRSLLARASALGVTGLAGCFGILGGGGDGTATETATRTTTETATRTATETTRGVMPPVVEAVVGEVVDGDAVRMAVESVRRTDELGQFGSPEPGMEFLVVRFGVKNATGDRFLDVSEFLVTELAGGGETYDRRPTTGGQRLPTGQLAPGELAYADLIYEVPTDSGPFTLTFDVFPPYVAVRRLEVDLSTTADSPGELTQDLAVSVAGPGSTVSRGGATVTLRGVETRGSIGDVEPDDGGLFLLADVEVKNADDAARELAPRRHTRCKDDRGLGYPAAVAVAGGVDRPLEAGELAAGESRRGTVPYAVLSGVTRLYWAFEFARFAGGNKAFWSIG